MSESCCNCSSSIGDDAKVQITNADGEKWCPVCFVTRRMHAEPDRFNATQAAAVRCILCGWVSVSFGALPGSKLRCGACGRFAGQLVRLDNLPLTNQERGNIEEIARAAGIKEPRRIARS